MANPPFNVKKVDKKKDYVINDPRLPFGLPKNDNGNNSQQTQQRQDLYFRLLPPSLKTPVGCSM